MRCAGSPSTVHTSKEPCDADGARVCLDPRSFCRALPSDLHTLCGSRAHEHTNRLPSRARTAISKTSFRDRDRAREAWPPVFGGPRDLRMKRCGRRGAADGGRRVPTTRYPAHRAVRQLRRSPARRPRYRRSVTTPPQRGSTTLPHAGTSSRGLVPSGLAAPRPRTSPASHKPDLAQARPRTSPTSHKPRDMCGLCKVRTFRRAVRPAEVGGEWPVRGFLCVSPCRASASCEVMCGLCQVRTSSSTLQLPLRVQYATTAVSCSCSWIMAATAAVAVGGQGRLDSAFASLQVPGLSRPPRACGLMISCVLLGILLTVEGHLRSPGLRSTSPKKGRTRQNLWVAVLPDRPSAAVSVRR
jgi:hypothetical protein